MIRNRFFSLASSERPASSIPSSSEFTRVLLCIVVKVVQVHSIDNREQKRRKEEEKERESKKCKTKGRSQNWEKNYAGRS